MSVPIITLTTDFGTRSPFVAAMKGALLSINPHAHVIDLSHDIPPFDVLHAAYFLRDSLPYFPPGTLHVVVVDPGVGSERDILHIEAHNQQLLAPDNGCWTLFAPRPLAVRQLRERRFWHANISSTFHGRDIFAPVAAHLSLGVDPAALGPILSQWRRFETRAVQHGSDGVTGEVVFIDHFGNLITNIPATSLAPRSMNIHIGDILVSRVVRTYSDAAVSELVALVGSNGHLEIAVVQGNAAARLDVRTGARVRIQWKT